MSLPSPDALPLERFQQDSDAALKRMRQSHTPLVLTRDGQPEAVVQSIEDYQHMAELAGRAEAIEGIRRGLEEMERGEGQDAFEFLEELRRKYELPDQ